MTTASQGIPFYFPGDGIHFAYDGNAEFGRMVAAKMVEVGWFNRNPAVPAEAIALVLRGDPVSIPGEPPSSPDPDFSAYLYGAFREGDCSRNETTDELECPFRGFEGINIAFKGAGGVACPGENKYNFTLAGGTPTPCDAFGNCPVLATSGQYLASPTLCAPTVLGDPCHWRFTVQVSDCSSPVKTRAHGVHVFTGW